MKVLHKLKVDYLCEVKDYIIFTVVDPDISAPLHRTPVRFGCKTMLVETLSSFAKPHGFVATSRFSTTNKWRLTLLRISATGTVCMLLLSHCARERPGRLRCVFCISKAADVDDNDLNGAAGVEPLYERTIPQLKGQKKYLPILRQQKCKLPHANDDVRTVYVVPVVSTCRSTSYYQAG